MLDLPRRDACYAIRATSDRRLPRIQRSASTHRKVHDLIVVGAGPAGLAAAVYAASEGLMCWCVERARARRSGRRELQDRELPGLPDRHFRPGARRAGVRPGAEVRCARADREERDHLVCAAQALRSRYRRGLTGTSARHRHRDRRRIPQASDRGTSALRGRRRVLRGDIHGSATLRRRGGRSSSAAATRRARPPCSWPRPRSACTCSCARAAWPKPCRAT